MKKIIALALALWATSQVHAQTLEVDGLIDIHAHLGRFAGFDLSLPTLLSGMHDNHVQYALVSNIDGADVSSTANLDETAANEATWRTCKDHPELLPLAWVRPGQTSTIEVFLRDRHFYGMKFHPDFNHFKADSPTVIPYLQLCDKYHIPAVFHCGDSDESSADRIYAAARRFPSVPVVLYHMGFGTDHRAAIAAVKSALDKHDANLYLETAQVEPAAVLDAIHQVGAGRVLFGTDATYYGKHHYERYGPMLGLLKSSLSAADFRAVVHDNAVAVFHIH